MPKLILLEGTQEFVRGHVSTKVTGRNHIGYCRHERRRADAASWWQMEHGAGAGASLSQLQRNRERISALPGGRQTAGARADAEGSHASVRGHGTRTLTQRTTSS